MGQQGQRVAIYCRVSTDDQSCERQELETLDELHDRGVSVLPLNGRSFDLNSANGRLKIKKVLAMHRDGLSNRLIGRNIGLSKNTVMEIVRRAAA